MRRPHHALLQWLLAMALLWQSGALSAAVCMPCCEAQQVCCLVGTGQSRCAVCIPAPAPTAAAAALHPQALAQQLPAGVVPALPALRSPSIWRPPMSGPQQL